MLKEGLETYNVLIKIFILLLCISIRQDRDIELQLLDYNYVYIHNNLHDKLNYNFDYYLQMY